MVSTKPVHREGQAEADRYLNNLVELPDRLGRRLLAAGAHGRAGDGASDRDIGD